MQPQANLPHIIFLFSDTGGGHRSAAEALIEALHLEFPGQLTADMLDIFRQYMPPPLKSFPEMYPPLALMPEVWELGYRIIDGRQRSHLMYNAFWPYVRRYIHRLLDENPCDLVVSVHPLINTPVRRALAGRGIPFATVVTDMVSTHAAWYDAYARPIIVATDEARHRALKLGMRPDQVHVIGQPVAERFCHPPEDRAALRRKLGWPEDRPVILLVGGGEGMGPLHDTVKAIDHARLPAALVVVCGRNRKLKERLEAHDWQLPIMIYGFVREMPDFMAAADILVTKAGPGTISEAFIAGLPLILYARLPGQEDGNVTYVIDHGAGTWAPEPELVVEDLQRWLDHPEKRMKAREVCLTLARPQASRQIARLLAESVGLKKPAD